MAVWPSLIRLFEPERLDQTVDALAATQRLLAEVHG